MLKKQKNESRERVVYVFFDPIIRNWILKEVMTAILVIMLITAYIV